MNPLAHLRAFPDILQVSLAGMVAWRAEMAIWILATTMPLVMLALWNAVTANGAIGGYDQVDMARYFTATLVVRQLTGAWIVWELNYEIRTGGLSPRLLKPVHPLWNQALWTIAAQPTRLIILAPMIAALVAWRPEMWASPGAGALALFAVSAALAGALSFLTQAFFGCLSFWFDKSLGLWGVWFGLWALLSGYVAPLDLFPAWAQAALTWSPFRAMLATPVELLAGVVSPRDALPLVGAQAAWTAAFLAIVAFTWKAGIRRYGAFGA